MLPILFQTVCDPKSVVISGILVLNETMKKYLHGIGLSDRFHIINC
jgi:hypothetical protein